MSTNGSYRRAGRSAHLGKLAALPQELAFLAEPAARYRFDSEQDVFRFLDKAGAVELEELAAIAERVRLERLYPKVLDICNTTLRYADEGWWLYFLFGAMDYADLEFDHRSDLGDSDSPCSK